MAWDWSHTDKAYNNAYDNLHDKPHHWLVMCLAEIKATPKDDYGQYSALDMQDDIYERERQKVESWDSESIAEKIWEFMQDYRTCTNGGFEAYCCPFGCHTISFDRDE